MPDHSNVPFCLNVWCGWVGATNVQSVGGSGGDTVGGLNNWEQGGRIQEGHHTQLYPTHLHLWYVHNYSCKRYTRMQKTYLWAL